MLCNPPFLRGGELERGGLDLEAEGRQEEVQKERRRGGLDFEAEERQEEVQKERKRAAEWTLRWRRRTRKSKRSEKERRNGL